MKGLGRQAGRCGEAVRKVPVDAEAIRATVLWVFVASHGLGDFLVQGGSVVQGRLRRQLSAYGMHGLGHLLPGALFTVPAWSYPLAAAWLAIVAAHLLVDLGKDRLQARLERPAQRAWLFVVDQAVHLWVIWLGVRLVPAGALRGWAPGSAVFGLLFGADGELYLGATGFWRGASIYLLVVLGGAVLIRQLLEACRVLPEAERGEGVGGPRTGAYIGMLERALVLSFLLLGAYGAVGLVVAAKSLVRFGALQQRSFAEYYLVGTLLSLLVALGGFMVLYLKG